MSFAPTGSNGQPPRALMRTLAEAVGGHLVEGAELSRLSTWRIGGKAWAAVEPGSLEELRRTHDLLRRSGTPWIVVGAGSNLLFDDRGLRGVIIRLGRRFSRFSIQGDRVNAEAGLGAIRFARAVGAAGLAGAEHLIGIPGTVGGLVFMNGGSNRQSIGDRVLSVGCLDADGNPIRLQAGACAFGYRSSIFDTNGFVITDAELRFIPGDKDAIRKAMLEGLRTRREKFPLKQPNCGSVFATDPGLYRTRGPAGAVIEGLGLKGARVGGASVSVKHANFIVNEGSATSADVLSLIARIRSAVHREKGCWLECEVRHVSPEGRITRAHHVVP